MRWRHAGTNVALVTLLLTPSLIGQQATGPQAPTLGFVFDRVAGGLRTIIGFPGAAYLGALFEAGENFSSLVLAPRQDFALGIRVRDSQLFLISLAGTPAPVRVGNIGWIPEHIALSPSGHKAVLADPSGRIRFVTGLPDSPAFSDESDFGATVALQAIAISDDGLVLAAFGDMDTPSRLYTMRAGSEPQSIGTGQRATAICFLSGSDSALVADETARQIMLYTLSYSAATERVVAAEADGVSDPVAMNVSGGGRWAVVGNAADQTVLRIDLSGAGSPVAFPCNCHPSEITRLAGDAVFQLGGLSDQPLWIFDGDDVNPRVVFVPAPTAGRPTRGPR